MKAVKGSSKSKGIAVKKKQDHPLASISQLDVVPNPSSVVTEPESNFFEATLLFQVIWVQKPEKITEKNVTLQIYRENSFELQEQLLFTAEAEGKRKVIFNILFKPSISPASTIHLKLFVRQKKESFAEFSFNFNTLSKQPTEGLFKTHEIRDSKGHYLGSSLIFTQLIDNKHLNSMDVHLPHQTSVLEYLNLHARQIMEPSYEYDSIKSLLEQQTTPKNKETEVHVIGAPPVVSIVQNPFSTAKPLPSTPTRSGSIISRSDLEKSIMDCLCDNFHGWWTDPIDKIRATLVPVNSGSREFDCVSKIFGISCPSLILSIDRVQSVVLWEGYQLKRNQMLNLTSNPNEQTLFHGTQKEVIPRINQQGFDKGFSKVAFYGNGVYFAKNSSYSACSTYSKKDEDGIQRMYLAFVLVGVFARGEKGMIAPPPIPSESHILCDSLVDDMNNPTVFVTFKDTQAYPAYVISFKSS